MRKKPFKRPKTNHRFRKSRKLDENERHRTRAVFRALDGHISILVSKDLGALVAISTKADLNFQLDGNAERVTPSDLVAYGNHLLALKLAVRVTKQNDVFTYRFSPGAMSLLLRPGFSSISGPITYSPDMKTRQKPVGPDPGRPVPTRTAAASKPVKETVSNDMTTSPAAPLTSPSPRTDLPLASEMCWPMLQFAGARASKFSALVDGVAAALNFDKRTIALPMPLNTNQTFYVRMQAAAEYLTKKSYLKRVGKMLSTTPKGDDQIRSGQPPVTWPEFIEPKVRSKVTRLTDLPLESRSAYYSINTDVKNSIATFATAETHKLVSIFQNAVRILENPRRTREHYKAQLVLDAVTTELDKRAIVSNGDERFKWPSTEARSGDGSLRFDKSQSEGMLAYLEYRVGRTNGSHSTVRQSILSRIFERSLPPVFEKAYMDEWGGNGTATRLRKMGESIAAFARNAKRKDDDRLDEAIRHWEQDLKFLHDRYYVGKFFFGWPSSAIDGPSIVRKR